VHSKSYSNVYVVVYIARMLIAVAQCLLTYNYVISTKDGGDSARRAVMMKDLAGGQAGQCNDSSHASRTLLLGGRHDGCLCVYNWDTGADDYVSEVLRLFGNTVSFGMYKYLELYGHGLRLLLSLHC